MKKSLLVLSGIFTMVTGASAQITITTADVAAPFSIIYQATDTMPTGITAGGAGASQTWNMTALTQDFVDTLNFIPYSFAPNPKFSSSNLVVKQGWENIFSYAVNNSSALTSLGVSGTVDFGGGPETYTAKNTPAEILMNFPGMFNGTYVNNYKTVVEPIYAGAAPVDSFRQVSAVKKTVLIDAWGSLTTPLGTYSVLRVKETKVTNDTADAYLFGSWMNGIQITADSSTNYTWWANGIGFPLVTVRKDSSNSVYEVQWLMSNPVAGVNEFSTEEAIIYPNPAQNELNFVLDTKEQVTIEVMDITGRKIRSVSVTGDRSVLNTSDFANGTYTYAIFGEQNQLMKRGKFAIVK
ncbi:MAG: T9SS type A sorting domain-containing protein [Bacteroidota bacterium]|nr:T9SS type A sorting domain-containing protein [Bacteroidota bacterium]